MRTIKTYCKGAPFYKAFLRHLAPVLVSRMFALLNLGGASQAAPDQLSGRTQ